MVNLKSIVIALSLIFTDLTLIFEDTSPESSPDGATLVFLTSLAVLVSHLRLFPQSFSKSCYYLCLFSEVCILLLIFELGLRFFWMYIRDFVASNAENLIVEMYNRKKMETIICYMCCGRRNCVKFFSDLIVKLLSFGFLTTALVTLTYKDNF